jgi:hypothetical protein
MNLYLLTIKRKIEWDTYDSAVVAAVNEDIARNMHPSGNWSKEEHYEEWCPKDQVYDQVVVKKIGEADGDIQPGVICASFNAG